MSDEQLIDLGVAHMGDRVIIKNVAKTMKCKLKGVITSLRN